MSEPESAILVLGGLGAIGREFVRYILTFQLSTYVRIVDRAVPSMAYLSQDHLSLLEKPNVEVVQANLMVPAHVERAFAPSERVPCPFQMVVNLAGEERHGLPDDIYTEGTTKLRTLCAKQAVAVGVQKYIEVSTAQVYGGGEKPATERDSLKPWTKVGKAHAAAEAAVLELQTDLDVSVLRLPIVYGGADRAGLMPRLSVAAVYQKLRQKMELLWGAGLRIHTVHVQDVAACLWHLLCAGERGGIYNLVDSGDTTQGSLCDVLRDVFPGLTTGYYGTISSNVATLKLEELVEEANEGHQGPWDDMCRAAGITHTPLTPWIEKELLYHHHVSLDGSKIAATGFECSCPKVTKELLQESIAYWVQLEKFPPSLSA